MPDPHTVQDRWERIQQVCSEARAARERIGEIADELERTNRRIKRYLRRSRRAF